MKKGFCFVACYLLAAAFVYVLYLMALNGRYEAVEKGCWIERYDKWTGEFITPTPEQGARLEASLSGDYTATPTEDEAEGATEEDGGQVEVDKPLKILCNSLKADNYQLPSYDRFESILTTGGNHGEITAAKNRHALYNSLKADNYDVPSTYESFYTTLFEPVSKTRSRARERYKQQKRRAG